MKQILLYLSAKSYRYVVRPIFFLFDSEKIHEFLTGSAEIFGQFGVIRNFVSIIWRVKDPSLEQDIKGIHFDNPIGLAAGFDYNTELSDILPSIGFGFGSMGTITNLAYEGNKKPRLGRLIESRSLLVNKGFKNPGIDKTLKKLSSRKFTIPAGLSVGKTNGVISTDQNEAINDIMSTFEKAENSKIPFSYYELNISCPNLKGTVEFYSPAHLNELLAAVTMKKLSKPLFIKMPIEKSDDETLKMLEIISHHGVAGVIFGNLQKNRKDPALRPEEVERCGEGHFSGKPTEKRSNELIRLAYKNFGNKLVIIGCGGVFSAKDAYKKIRLGASLVQLVTGLIYVGPQLPGQINAGLIKLIRRDGFFNIREAVGADNKTS